MKNRNFLIVVFITAFVVTLIGASVGIGIVETNPEKFTVEVKPEAIIKK